MVKFKSLNVKLQKKTFAMHSTDIFDGFGRSVEINFDRKVSNFGGLSAAFFYLRRNGFFKTLRSYFDSDLPNNRQVK